ncbi:MAG: STAS domain-containing protein [Terriglobales bacterium]
MLRVITEELDGTAILHCAGRIVRGDETALLCAALRHRDQRIVLDLSEVEAIDAAGIGALVSLQAAGIYLQLLNPVKAVREVLRVTKLDTIFEICSSPAGEQQKDLRAELQWQEIATDPLPLPMAAI